ncbi:HEPN domain-containing protein [Mycobacterium vicinigordonae]|uniref:Uncharacterized protein n=1 Tax=Mycobacterium vicinigordonae TaxID=1719132 RepID=A0A7D6E1Y7_9MYCO|nr:HEPN domain-containing protein [Mycobacterium vicinigordonae]QLL08990.1 hypothetical protein H0P51_08910 [Mycobacterium vicinigordonae]
MDELIANSLAGSVGYVWPFFEKSGFDNQVYAGHLAQSDDRFKVSVLAPSPIGVGLGPLEGQKRIPSSLLAVSEVHGTLAFDITRIGGTTNIGGVKASSRDYYCRAIAVGFPADELKSSRMYEMAAYFPGLEHWSRIRGSKSEVKHDEYHRPTVINTTIRSAPEQVTRFSKYQTLVVSTHFEVTGPRDDRRAYTPLSISSITESAVDWRFHMNVLLSIQNLISLCWDGFVRADGGYVRLDLSEPEETSNAKLWSQRLMEIPAAVQPAPPSTTFPLVRYETLGGVDGLRRWVRLAEAHPRAVGPITSRNRVARSPVVESVLHDICVAIEYWVNYHKSIKRSWAKPRSQRDSQAERLARWVGNEFGEFVGDPQKWARSLWQHYGDLKHQPTLSYDPYELYLLADSARILLTCALLNRVAGTKRPTRALCRATQNHDTGYDVRDLLDTQPNPALEI